MLTKILIVDANEDFRLALTQQLGPGYRITCCEDGQAAMDALRTDPPDLLVLDLTLPGIDGITVLQQAYDEGILPPVLVTAYDFSSYMGCVLGSLGVEYVVRKPCCLEAMVSRIEDILCHARTGLFLPASSIAGILVDLGLPTHRRGFRYCEAALELLLDDPFQQVTKTVYPEIGKRYGVKASSVEKDIRDAVNDAWRSGNRRVWLRYFPAAPNGQIPHPTNTVFLTRLREALWAASAIAR